uniref:Putative tick transposon n=1 Tax=Rhipicephalus microplus TaxID=6941 RepID=A0A6M2CLP2_RHIMP
MLHALAFLLNSCEAINSVHPRDASQGQGGILALHSKDCTCSPIFNEGAIVSKHKRNVRDIIEAEVIQRFGNECVSSVSIMLSKRVEIFFALPFQDKYIYFDMPNVAAVRQ